MNHLYKDIKDALPKKLDSMSNVEKVLQSLRISLCALQNTHDDDKCFQLLNCGILHMIKILELLIVSVPLKHSNDILDLILECVMVATDHGTNSNSIVATFITEQCLRVVMSDKVDFLSRIKVLNKLNIIFESADSSLKETVLLIEFIRSNLSKLFLLVLDTGDYEFQVCMVEYLFRLIPRKLRQQYSRSFIKDLKTQEAFLAIRAACFEVDCRKFLNEINSNKKTHRKVFSYPCHSIRFGAVELQKPCDEGYDAFWLDINLESRRIIIFCENASLSSQVDATDDGWDTVAIWQADVDMCVCQEEEGWLHAELYIKSTAACIPHGCERDPCAVLTIVTDLQHDMSRGLCQLLGKDKMSDLMDESQFRSSQVSIRQQISQQMNEKDKCKDEDGSVKMSRKRAKAENPRKSNTHTEEKQQKVSVPSELMSTPASTVTVGSFFCSEATHSKDKVKKASSRTTRSKKQPDAFESIFQEQSRQETKCKSASASCCNVSRKQKRPTSELTSLSQEQKSEIVTIPDSLPIASQEVNTTSRKTNKIKGNSVTAREKQKQNFSVVTSTEVRQTAPSERSLRSRTVSLESSCRTLQRFQKQTKTSQLSKDAHGLLPPRSRSESVGNRKSTTVSNQTTRGMNSRQTKENYTDDEKLKRLHTDPKQPRCARYVLRDCTNRQREEISCKNVTTDNQILASASKIANERLQNRTKICLNQKMSEQKIKPRMDTKDETQKDKIPKQKKKSVHIKDETGQEKILEQKMQLVHIEDEIAKDTIPEEKMKSVHTKDEMAEGKIPEQKMKSRQDTECSQRFQRGNTFGKSNIQQVKVVELTTDTVSGRHVKKQETRCQHEQSVGKKQKTDTAACRQFSHKQKMTNQKKSDCSDCYKGTSAGPEQLELSVRQRQKTETTASGRFSHEQKADDTNGCLGTSDGSHRLNQNSACISKQKSQLIQQGSVPKSQFDMQSIKLKTYMQLAKSATTSFAHERPKSPPVYDSDDDMSFGFIIEIENGVKDCQLKSNDQQKTLNQNSNAMGNVAAHENKKNEVEMYVEENAYQTDPLVRTQDKQTVYQSDRRRNTVQSNSSSVGKLLQHRYDNEECVDKSKDSLLKSQMKNSSLKLALKETTLKETTLKSALKKSPAKSTARVSGLLCSPGSSRKSAHWKQPPVLMTYRHENDAADNCTENTFNPQGNHTENIQHETDIKLLHDGRYADFRSISAGLPVHSGLGQLENKLMQKCVKTVKREQTVPKLTDFHEEEPVNQKNVSDDNFKYKRSKLHTREMFASKLTDFHEEDPVTCRNRSDNNPKTSKTHTRKESATRQTALHEEEKEEPNYRRNVSDNNLKTSETHTRKEHNTWVTNCHEEEEPDDQRIISDDNSKRLRKRLPKSYKESSESSDNLEDEVTYCSRSQKSQALSKTTASDVEALFPYSKQRLSAHHKKTLPSTVSTSGQSRLYSGNSKTDLYSLQSESDLFKPHTTANSKPGYSVKESSPRLKNKQAKDKWKSKIRTTFSWNNTVAERNDEDGNDMASAEPVDDCSLLGSGDTSLSSIKFRTPNPWLQRSDNSLNQTSPHRLFYGEPRQKKSCQYNKGEISTTPAGKNNRTKSQKNQNASPCTRNRSKSVKHRKPTTGYSFGNSSDTELIDNKGQEQQTARPLTKDKSKSAKKRKQSPVFSFGGSTDDESTVDKKSELSCKSEISWIAAYKSNVRPEVKAKKTYTRNPVKPLSFLNDSFSPEYGASKATEMLTRTESVVSRPDHQNVSVSSKNKPRKFFSPLVFSPVSTFKTEDITDLDQRASEKSKVSLKSTETPMILDRESAVSEQSLLSKLSQCLTSTKSSATNEESRRELQRAAETSPSPSPVSLMTSLGKCPSRAYKKQHSEKDEFEKRCLNKFGLVSGPSSVVRPSKSVLKRKFGDSRDSASEDEEDGISENKKCCLQPRELFPDETDSQSGEKSPHDSLALIAMPKPTTTDQHPEVNSDEDTIPLDEMMSQLENDSDADEPAAGLSTVLKRFGCDLQSQFKARKYQVQRFANGALKLSNKWVNQLWTSERNHWEQAVNDFKDQVTTELSALEQEVTDLTTIQKKAEAIYLEQLNALLDKRESLQRRVKTTEKCYENFQVKTHQIQSHGHQAQRELETQMKQDMERLKNKLLLDMQHEQVRRVKESMQKHFL